LEAGDFPGRIRALIFSSVMPLSDPFAFQLAGFSEGDVDEILADLDYLHRNSRWTHRRDQVERMIVESPVILLDFPAQRAA
jgi:hypothetical protein